MAKMHFHHLHGALCRTKVDDSALTEWSGFVTCKNCLWLMTPVMQRLKRGENAIGVTYSRQCLLVKRAIWELSTTPRGGKGSWPTIHELSDYLEIAPARVFDMCDTEQGIRVSKVSGYNGVMYDLTRASIVNV